MKAVPITTGKLADRLECRIEGDAELLINGIATIEEAEKDHLTFLANPRYRKHLPNCRAGAIIIDEKEETPASVTRIISTKPYTDFQSALGIIYQSPEPEIAKGISQRAQVHESAVIGKDVCIGDNVVINADTQIGDGCIISHGAFIGTSVRIGKNCEIGFNAVIRRDTIIGNRVVIGDGTVISSDGFGYVPDASGYHKIPQIGSVVIEDDVEIGANCCIDRATVGCTRIGRGSKLDNLIQIAHGVQIGEDTVIAAQTGISGSTRIGSKVIIAGQAGFVGHIEIGDNMVVGAQSGITKSHDIKGLISGYPARPHSESVRRDANINRIPKILERLKELERKSKKE
ncbi:UDP-3-O-(3-hydroxymyristoyl)glucosamine N-acyltransferase [bacterium]|nr:UDP-3-O-(3-hydroxymyristoyl)glucosamine N-acyltransferase [bacterium]